MFSVGSISIVVFVYLFTLVASIGFKGQVINVPDAVEEVYLEKGASILNANNYQSRFDIELIKMQNTTELLQSTKTVLTKDYQFTFNDIDEGEYLLNINSYDFILEQTRYRVKVDSNIKVYTESLWEDSYNFSTEAIVGLDVPLSVVIKDTKQYYERSSGSLKDMIIGSPVGFIFKSKAYTIFFSISLVIMVTPYIINWINPEFSKLLEESDDVNENENGNEGKNPNEGNPVSPKKSAKVSSTPRIRNARDSYPGIRKRR